MEKRPYAPMLPTPTKELPAGEQWCYEAKLDGYRMEGVIRPTYTALFSKNGHNYTEKYPAVTEQLPEAFPKHGAVLDGEMVGFDTEGQPSFHTLQKKHPRVVYFIFDILELDREPLINKPLIERRKLLGQFFVKQTNVQLSYVSYDRSGMLHAAQQLDMEGVVAKNLRSLYKPGKRSRDWQKLRFEPNKRNFNK